MTDGRSKLVLAAMAALVLTLLGLWLWRSESPSIASPPPSPTAATDAAATLAVSNAPTPAPIERTEAPAPPPPTAPAGADLAHVRGRCVDEAGRPLANCRAKFDGHGGNSNRMALQGKVDWTDPEPVDTDADGRFDIAFAPPSGMQFGLDVQAEGRVPRTGRWSRIQPTQVIELGDIAMMAGFEVRGRVLDELGAPVAKVGVTLNNLPLPLAPDMAANNMRSGFSAPDGEFCISVPIPVGTWALDLQAAGVRLLSPDRVTVAASGAEPLQVTVRRTPSIEGIVVDEQGQPVARVYLNAELNRSGRMASAWSRKDGTFVIHAVDADPKPVKLRIDDPGPCEPSWTDERLWEWGSKDVRIVLERALSFELTVVERGTGAPVTQYAVSCYSAKARSSLQKDLRLGGEHVDGRVTVDRIWRGKNFLQVMPIDKALQPSAIVEFEASDAGVAPLRVEVDRLQQAIVRATTVGGEPVVGSKVEVVVKGSQAFDANAFAQESRSGNRGFSTDPNHRFHELIAAVETGADGSAAVFVPPPSPALVVRVTGAHPPVVVEPAVFVSGRDLVVVVPESGGIVGKVTLRGLEPCRIFVRLQLPDGQDLPRGNRDGVALEGDGSFALRGLAAGSHRLRLRYSVPVRTEHGGSGGGTDLAVDVPEVAVVAGRDTEIVIDASAMAPASLRGRVLLDGAVPTPARAFVRSEPGTLYGQFVPDADGVFEAAGLLPGTYRAILVVGDFQAGEGARILGDDTFTLAAGEQLARDFAFTRRRLVVTILQADGKAPAAGQRVIATGRDFNHHFAADDQGVLVIDPAPAGKINLQLIGSQHRDVVEVPAGKTMHEVTLTLRARR